MATSDEALEGSIQVCLATGSHRQLCSLGLQESDVEILMLA